MLLGSLSFYELFLWLFFIYVFCLYCHCFTTSEDVMFYWYLKVAVIHLQAVWPQLKMNNSRRITLRDQLMKCCHSLCCHGDCVAEGVFTQRCLNRCWSLGKKCQVFIWYWRGHLNTEPVFVPLYIIWVQNHSVSELQRDSVILRPVCSFWFLQFLQFIVQKWTVLPHEYICSSIHNYKSHLYFAFLL